MRLESDRSLSEIAGGLNATANFVGQDGQFARAAMFGSIRSITVGPSGALYVGEVVAGNNANGIHIVTAELPTRSVDEIAYPSKDGREVYYFTTGGRHKRTEDPITGAVKYKFLYDASQRLTQLIDVNADTITIERNQSSGAPEHIIAPYGQTTTLSLSGGFLSGVTNPMRESYGMTYHSDAGTANGLLHVFTNPRNKTSTYTYRDADGRLDEDLDAVTASVTFEQPEDGVKRTVVRTSGEGVHTRYSAHQLPDGIHRRFADYADGSHQTSVDSMVRVFPYGETIIGVGPSGDSTTLHRGRDYRFGWLAPADSVVVLRPGPSTSDTITRTRMFSNPNRFESVAFHGQRFVSAYDTSSQILTLRTPVGRTSTVSLDRSGRPTSLQVGALTAVSFGYDAHGKLIHLGQGSRGWSYLYDARGRRSSR